jgi:CheY-like chemotaxis protein
VLVVDDNASSRESLRHLLDSLQGETVLASTGEEALQRLEEAERSDRPFQLVLVDSGLMDVEGAQLAEKLQQFSSATGRLVLMTPAHTICANASWNQWPGTVWIAKPITRSLLVQCMGDVASALGEDPRGEADEGQAPGEFGGPFSLSKSSNTADSPRILLVEDDAVNQMYLQALLEQHGFLVTAVTQGNAAVKEMASGGFDLVLMDIQMPDMDGLEATRAIRRLETRTNRRTPIIGITAHALERDRQRCLEAGMDAHLPKPVEPRRLFAVAGQFLSSDPGPEIETEPSLDTSTLLGHLGGDKQILKSMVTTFLETAPRAIEDIQEALDANDPKGVATAAHAFRGSAIVFGATGLIGLSQKMEEMGEQGDLAVVEMILQEFEQELMKVSDLLAKAV